MLRAAAPLQGPLISAKRAAAAAGGASFVEQPPSRPSPYRVLELGAGTGYVGLWYIFLISHRRLYSKAVMTISICYVYGNNRMAHHGADALLTDLAVQMSTLRSNLYINVCRVCRVIIVWLNGCCCVVIVSGAFSGWY
jgi:hypothetical protein